MNRTYTYKPTELTATELEALEIELAEHLTRRRFLIGAGVLGLGVITGCGSQEEAVAPTGATTRTVTHALGTTEIPADPQRVVALADLVNGYALTSLGFDKLVGIGASSEDNPTGRLEAYGELPDEVPDADIGLWTQPNIEAIATLNPDLIIGTEGNHAEIYEQLSGIAPTVLMPAEMWEREEPFAPQRFVAQVVGIEAALDARLAEYEARLNEVRVTLGSKLDGMNYTWIDVFGPTDVYVIRNQVAPGNIVLRDLGAVRSPTTNQENFGDETFPQISLELIPTVDADVIFVGLGVLESETEANAELEVLLAATTAGRAEQVFPIRYEAWGFPVVEGLFIALDDLEALLADRELTTSGEF